MNYQEIQTRLSQIEQDLRKLLGQIDPVALRDMLREQFIKNEATWLISTLHQTIGLLARAPVETAPDTVQPVAQEQPTERIPDVQAPLPGTEEPPVETTPFVRKRDRRRS